MNGTLSNSNSSHLLIKSVFFWDKFYITVNCVHSFFKINSFSRIPSTMAGAMHTEVNRSDKVLVVKGFILVGEDRQ